MKPNPIGRKLLIRSKSVYSRDVTIHDADTGENISGVSKVVITLNIKKGFNEAEITYFDVDDNGGVTPIDGEIMCKTTKVQNVEIDDITAFEIMDNIRKERNA